MTQITPQQPYQQPYPVRPMPTASPKSPGVAAVLSVLVPGLGHLYSGNPMSAVFWFVSAFISALLILVAIGIFLFPVVWLGAIVHAYVSTANFNRRHHVVR
jgi:TM2 domain-containing membrane protein YozV